MRALKVTLPSALRGRPGIARRARLTAGGRHLRRPKLTARGRTLTLTLARNGVRSADLRLAPGALRQLRAIAVGRRLRFAILATRSGGGRLTATAPARAAR